MSKILYQYSNGNASVVIHDDGTRIIEAPGNLKLDYPLNIDVRLSRKCTYGHNPDTGKSVCGFFHESATTDGNSATWGDIDAFFASIKGLPEGTEIALGVNQFDSLVYYFLGWCKERKLIVNITVNQGFLKRDGRNINLCIADNLVHGLGISYRPNVADIPAGLTDYQNMVVHVIAGINTIEEVKLLATKGVKKILVLGEKDFGFNLGKVRLVSDSHRQWYRQVHELFDLFDVVSFDNLALEQLNVKRFVKNWEEMYQHEFSFYANVVDKTFSPSSRSPEVTPFMPVQKYFGKLFEI